MNYCHIMRFCVAKHIALMKMKLLTMPTMNISLDIYIISMFVPYCSNSYALYFKL